MDDGVFFSALVCILYGYGHAIVKEVINHKARKEESNKRMQELKSIRAELQRTVQSQIRGKIK